MIIRMLGLVLGILFIIMFGSMMFFGLEGDLLTPVSGIFLGIIFCVYGFTGKESIFADNKKDNK